MVKEITMDDWERLVEGSDVPVLVEFVTSTCPTCATMAPAVERIAANLGERGAVYRVNVEREQVLAMRYGVQGVPTFMVFCQGNQVSSQVGEVYPTLLERMVTEAGEFGGQCAAKATKVPFEMSGYF
ncbi:MAG: thioredoxin family protein [Thermoplasmata archaeon]|nr:MAG: thioredoxin family protein [Thermoplasmata archaeon]